MQARKGANKIIKQKTRLMITCHQMLEASSAVGSALVVVVALARRAMHADGDSDDEE